MHSLAEMTKPTLPPSGLEQSLFWAETCDPGVIWAQKEQSVTGGRHRLVVTQQTSFEREEFSANGSHQVLHYVMKNKVYTADIALERIATGGEDLFFSDRGVDLRASLFYDSSDRKEVASHITRPLSYKGKQLLSRGAASEYSGLGSMGTRVKECEKVKRGRDQQKKSESASFVNLSLTGMRSGAADAMASFEPAGAMRVEFSIAVLSSHHHGSNFLIKFEAIDCQTGQPLVNVTSAVSQPISVISKPDVLQKKRLKEASQGQGKRTGALQKRAPPKTQAILVDLQKTTGAILQQMQELVQNSQGASVAGSIAGKKRLCSEREENPEEALGSHLRAALEALARIPGADRPQKVRRLVNNLRAHESDRLVELSDAVSAAMHAPRSSGVALNASGSRLPFDLPQDFTKLDQLFYGV